MQQNPDKYKNRVDFAILKNDSPIIAIECKAVGAALKDDRGQLRAYFNAAPSVKMGVLTDGLVYEFYADSDEPNMMDNTAFLTVDLRQVAKGKVEDNVLDGMRGLQKAAFDPENIGAEAKRKLVFRNLLQQIDSLAENPTEGFVRLLLGNVGLTHIRSKALSEYQDLTKAAFAEFINLRILRRLDLPQPVKDAERIAAAEPPPAAPDTPAAAKPEDKIVTTASEMEVLAYVKQRLAFLVKDEAMFREIEHIGFRDYQGKFVIFYKRERKGRILDLVEGEAPRLRITFAEGGEVSGDSVSALQLDGPLLALFTKRVQEDSKAPVAA